MHVDRTRRRAAWVWALGLSVALSLVAGVALAGKPAPKPGEIYYHTDGSWWVTSPNGRDKTELTLDAELAIDHEMAPSWQLHDGVRWFVRQKTTDTGTYPDGSPHIQLFVVSEDGSGEVQLTEDTSVQFVVRKSTNWWPHQVVQWKPGDQAISYVAYTWVDGEIDEAGIYRLPIAYDVDGRPSGRDGPPTLVVASSIVVDGAGRTHVRAERGHAWSPDGEKIVHCNWDADGGSSNNLQEVRLTDVDDPYSSLLLTHTTLSLRPGPSWSEDDVIVYASNDGWGTLELLDPDGTSRTTLLEVERRAHDFNSPSFSPDGSWIVYADNGPAKFGKEVVYVSVLYVVSVDSARTTKLTEGTVTHWR